MSSHRPSLRPQHRPSKQWLVALACALGLVATTLVLPSSPEVATEVLGARAKSLPSDVLAASETVVQGEVASTAVVERNGMLWTVATIEVDRVAKGTAPPTVRVAWLGGSDPASGRWTEATHTPNLPEGARAMLGLVPGPADLGEIVADALGIDDPTIHQVWGGERGALSDAVESSSAARYALIGLAWQDMPISYRINPNVSTLLPNAEEIIHRSIATWTNDPNSDVSFVFEGESTTTDTDWPFTNTIFAGNAPGILGQAVFGGDQGPGIINQFDVIMNNGPLVANLPWHDGAQSMTFDLGSVVMHELGHALGLDHSSETGTIMYAVLDAGNQLDELAADDAAGINALYPAANPPTPTPTPAPATPTAVPATPTPGGTPTTPSSSCGNPPLGAIVGTSGNDTITGTDGPDVIFGGAGDDVIAGMGGDDVICGGPGNDTIFGQAGDDSLYGDDGNDKLRGGDDDDALWGGDDADDLNGGRGDDEVHGEGGDDTKVRGGTGDDMVTGGAGNDALIAGNGGSDTVHGDDGNDSLISGGPRPDTIYGGNGNDSIKGLGGADFIYGGAGDDELLGGKQPDKILDGGSGTDICNGGADLTAVGALSSCETTLNTA